MRSGIHRAAWLCILLVLIALAAKTAHVHELKTADTSCALCVVSHCAPLPSVAAQPTIAPLLAISDLVVITQPAPTARLFSSERFTRPPPLIES